MGNTFICHTSCDLGSILLILLKRDPSSALYSPSGCRLASLTASLNWRIYLDLWLETCAPKPPSSSKPSDYSTSRDKYDHWQRAAKDTGQGVTSQIFTCTLW